MLLYNATENGYKAVADVRNCTQNKHNSTNGMMPQLSCVTQTEVIKNCRYFGGPIKGGGAPSATGFMVSKPWQIAPAPLNKNFLFKMNFLIITYNYTSINNIFYKFLLRYIIYEPLSTILYHYVLLCSSIRDFLK